MLIIGASQVLILGMLGWGMWQYVRVCRCVDIVRHKLKKVMNCDTLIDQLLADQAGEEGPGAPAGPAAPNLQSEATTATDIASKRGRLAALAAGGQTSQYVGKRLTVDQVDAMPDTEVENLYVRYEARLGAAMTKTLGQAALQLYASAVSRFLPIPPENQPTLLADLEADPFVGHALSRAACELYYRYGMYLAPLTAALTTAKHCQFEAAPSNITSDDDVHARDCDHRKEGDACTRGSGYRATCGVSTTAGGDYAIGEGDSA